MDIKIEITSKGYPLPHHPDMTTVVKAKIDEQESILNALSREQDKATEKLAMLTALVKESTVTRQRQDSQLPYSQI